MVDTDVHNQRDDACVDIPGVPYARYWAIRWRSFTSCDRYKSAPGHRWRLHLPRHWIYGVFDGLLGLPVPSHDAETTQGKPEAWYVHLRWSIWLHHLRNYGYGSRFAGCDYRRIYGRGTNSWHDIHCNCQLGRVLAMGVMLSTIVELS